MKTHGFGLLETMIALTIAATSSLLISRIFVSLFKGQKRIDQKAEVQDFGNRVRGLLYDERTCAATLLGGASLEFDPQNLSAFNNSGESRITLRFGDGTSFVEGSGIDMLRLQINNEALPAGGHRYEASLVSGAPRVILSQSGIRPLTIPIILTTEAGTGSQRKIVGCSSKGNLDGAATCAAIGGRWLASLSRCYFGGDLKLGQYQCVSPDAFQSGGELEGSVVAECYRREGSRQIPYQCVNNKLLFKWGNSTTNLLPECACDENSGWVIRQANQTQAVCDGGAMVRVPDQRESFLLTNEITDNHYVGSTPSGGTIVSSPLVKQDLISNYDMLDTVSECYPDPDSDRVVTCQQGDNAVKGGAGSCLFVNGAVVNGNLGVGEGIVTNYTGWMYVTRNRYNLALNFFSARRTEVIEAFGLKCYRVKTVGAPSQNALSTPTTGLADPLDSSVMNILDTDRWKNASQCTFLGGAGATLEPAPILAGGILAFDYRGRYLSRHPCDQEGVSTDNLVGSLLSAPSLHRGACWYFRDVAISGDYAANTGVSYTGGNARYTGWVYLTESLPSGKYQVEGDKALTFAPGNTGYVTQGIPCNVGVRFSR